MVSLIGMVLIQRQKKTFGCESKMCLCVLSVLMPGVARMQAGVVMSE